ncbi:MAG TPA: Fic family protein [Flavobacteriales bacterium]|nr:Fic family protein [Flavobacteriales bacterium]
MAGYFEALDTISEAYADIRIGESELKHLHKLTLQYSIKDAWHRGGYKQRSNAVEATLPDGSRSVVFTTTPPGVETEDAMRALVTWYGQSDAVHPLVRVAAFCYEFVTIHPFQDGNGRLSRLLATLLLLQQGYPWVQYVSFEHEIERRKSEYYRVLRTCQAQRPGEDIGPWLHFFLDCLVVMMEKLRAKLRVQGAVTGLNERQRNILRYVQSHAGAQAGGIAASLSVPLPTVKKDLDALVRSGALLRAGTGRGTRYAAP